MIIQNSPLRAVLLGTALTLGFGSSALARVIPPPMSMATAQFFKSHPDKYAAFLAGLGADADQAVRPHPSTAGGGWTLVSPAPQGAGLCSPMLLTDGTVMVASCNTPDWYRLTPDQNGSYANGSWSQLASLPVINGTQYAPLYHASAVLPDGRVIIMGGEYNGTNTGVWTNLGAIYDPVADSWTAVPAPLGTQWGMIGDAESIVLTDGRFMLASCCSYHPAADAILNPKTLAWTEVPGPRFGGQYQDEQGYEMLPNGKVLTIDVWTSYFTGGPPSTNTELFDMGRQQWSRGANTPVSLPDKDQCGTFEIGPAPLRGDGTLVGFGANTGCVAGATADPTAILDTHTNTWKQGPNVPSVCDKDGATACSLADAPAAVMPTGDILFAASSGYGQAPTHFFQFSSTNAIEQVSDPLLHSTGQGAYSYFFLVLPNGQVLSSDFSRKLEVYTPTGTPVSQWAPVIYHVPGTISPGRTYRLIGGQLNGRSAGAYYGDDAQMPTNFPIVRVVNTATGHVFYGRTSHFSTMGVAPGALGSTDFTLPAGMEAGPATLVAVANGVASKPVLINVK